MILDQSEACAGLSTADALPGYVQIDFGASPRGRITMVFFTGGAVVVKTAAGELEKYATRADFALAYGVVPS